MITKTEYREMVEELAEACRYTGARPWDVACVTVMCMHKMGGKRVLLYSAEPYRRDRVPPTDVIAGSDRPIPSHPLTMAHAARHMLAADIAEAVGCDVEEYPPDPDEDTEVGE